MTEMYDPLDVDFRADWGADGPLWAEPGPGGSMLWLDGIPVSKQLRGDLRDWQGWFEDLPVGLHLQEMPQEFHIQGQRLLKRIRSELGSPWRVTSSWYDGSHLGEGDKAVSGDEDH
jgi:hypothetical protein